MKRFDVDGDGSLIYMEDGDYCFYDDVKKLEESTLFLFQLEFLKAQLKIINEMAAESGYTAIQGIATRAIVLTTEHKLSDHGLDTSERFSRQTEIGNPMMGY